MSACEGREKEAVLKTLRSLPILTCKIGSFYHMEGEAKLTFADNILRGVAFMLVSF